jgi:hypothetical protein
VIPDRKQLDLFVSLLPARQFRFVVLAPGPGVGRIVQELEQQRPLRHIDHQHAGGATAVALFISHPGRVGVFRPLVTGPCAR